MSKYSDDSRKSPKLLLQKLELFADGFSASSQILQILLLLQLEDAEIAELFKALKSLIKLELGFKPLLHLRLLVKGLLYAQDQLIVGAYQLVSLLSVPHWLSKLAQPVEPYVELFKIGFCLVLSAALLLFFVPFFGFEECLLLVLIPILLEEILHLCVRHFVCKGGKLVLLLLDPHDIFVKILP